MKKLISLLPKLEKLDFIPVLGMRLWIANVFFRSGLTKIDSWSSTIDLFRDEYKVPLLPPEIAALMATSVELTAPILLALGLGTRLSAGALLAMTAVIEFTYGDFEIHKVWALMLLLIITHGPGRASIDYFIRKKLEKTIFRII
jgi:putative oxidoreductase